MTSSGPEQPFRGEYPSLENSPNQPDPNAPLDYPTDAGLPPPIYPPPPGYSAPPPIYPPPPPGYYQSAGYDPYRPITPPGTNGKAIAAIVSSVVGIMCCGVTSIAGVILGVIAMRETKRTGQDGYGIALAGAIIGGLAVAGWVIYLLLYIALMASGWSLV